MAGRRHVRHGQPHLPHGHAQAHGGHAITRSGPLGSDPPRVRWPRVPAERAYFNPRLAAAQAFLASLSPDAPELARACQKLMAARPRYVAPFVTQPPAPDSPIVPGDILSLPIDAPVSALVSTDRAGAPVLFIFYGEQEICIEDRRYIPIVETLVKQDTFRAGDAMSWTPRGTDEVAWEEMAALLESVVAAGIVLRG